MLTFPQLIRASLRATTRKEEDRLFREIRKSYPTELTDFLFKIRPEIEKINLKDAGFMCRSCEAPSPVKLPLQKCDACLEREEEEQNNPNASTTGSA